MRHDVLTAALVAGCLALGGQVGPAWAEMQLPKPGKIQADAATVAEFELFYREIEKALRAKDVGKIMSFYADDYLHHGITKRQIKFMWLEVFTNFDELYSVHVFTKITVHGDDAILVCTGGLFGISAPGEDYTTVDQWVTQNHWLTKVDGRWQMIGGATRQAPRQRGSSLALHPFF